MPLRCKIPRKRHKARGVFCQSISLVYILGTLVMPLATLHILCVSLTLSAAPALPSRSVTFSPDNPDSSKTHRLMTDLWAKDVVKLLFPQGRGWIINPRRLTAFSQGAHYPLEGMIWKQWLKSYGWKAVCSPRQLVWGNKRAHGLAQDNWHSLCSALSSSVPLQKVNPSQELTTDLGTFLV